MNCHATYRPPDRITSPPGRSTHQSSNSKTFQPSVLPRRSARRSRKNETNLTRTKLSRRMANSSNHCPRWLPRNRCFVTNSITAPNITSPVMIASRDSVRSICRLPYRSCDGTSRPVRGPYDPAWKGRSEPWGGRATSHWKRSKPDVCSLKPRCRYVPLAYNVCAHGLREHIRQPFRR